MKHVRLTLLLGAMWFMSAPAHADGNTASWIRVQSLSPGQWSVTGGGGSVQFNRQRFSADLKIDLQRSRRPDTQMVEGPDLRLEGRIVGSKVYARLLHRDVQRKALPITGTIRRSIVRDAPESDKLVFSGQWEFLTVDFEHSRPR